MLVTLHALPLGCMELHVLGLSKRFQAAGKQWLAHSQRLLPAFLTGSCLTSSVRSFLLSLKQTLQVTIPAKFCLFSECHSASSRRNVISTSVEQVALYALAWRVSSAVALAVP